MKPLTSRQQQILDVVTAITEQGQAFPSLSHIASQMGIKTKRGVAIHLDALERKGYIRRKTQHFELHESIASPSTSFPFATGLSAGHPKEAFDSNERIQFDRQFFGGGDLVAITVFGESMSGDSIHDGDVVIIDLSIVDDLDGIVAVRIDGMELTLKRISRQDRMLELIPSNPNVAPITVSSDRVEIVGKYMGLVRRG